MTETSAADGTRARPDVSMIQEPMKGWANAVETHRASLFPRQQVPVSTRAKRKVALRWAGLAVKHGAVAVASTIPYAIWLPAESGRAIGVVVCGFMTWAVASLFLWAAVPALLGELVHKWDTAVRVERERLERESNRGQP